MNMPIGNSLTKDQVLAMAACMLAVARVDGIRPEEVAVIRAFYAGSLLEDLPPFTAVEEANHDLTKMPGLQATVGEEDFAEQVVLASLLAGYADGQLSDGEYAQVCAIATRLGMSPSRVGELQLQVKDSLLGSLAHLPVSESVAAIAKTM